mmetsp:Transcript_57145/g.145072  ORF Transcript_57145/g.145072 Transcript_57145/m.145072 type:complete len:222 (+) Transcript_57145:3647-4312(+)
MSLISCSLLLRKSGQSWQLWATVRSMKSLAGRIFWDLVVIRTSARMCHSPPWPQGWAPSGNHWGDQRGCPRRHQWTLVFFSQTRRQMRKTAQVGWVPPATRPRMPTARCWMMTFSGSRRSGSSWSRTQGQCRKSSTFAIPTAPWVAASRAQSRASTAITASTASSTSPSVGLPGSPSAYGTSRASTCASLGSATTTSRRACAAARLSSPHTATAPSRRRTT